MTDFKPITFSIERDDTIARGRYLVEIANARYAVSGAGNAMIVLTLTIVDTVGRGDRRAAVGNTIDDRIVFTPRAYWRVRMLASVLRRLGRGGSSANSSPSTSRSMTTARARASTTDAEVRQLDVARAGAPAAS